MKIIHRYVLKETLWPFGFGFLFFNFILFIGVVFDLTRLIFAENAPPLKVLKLIIFSLPSFFDIIIPVSLFFSILLSFGRLSGDGEITALRSSGINIVQIEFSVLLFGIILTLISLSFSAFLTPWCNQKYKSIYQQILLHHPLAKFKVKTIIDLDNKKLYSLKLDEKNQTMQELILYDFSFPDQKFPQVTLAQKGKIKDEKIFLQKVKFYRFNKDYRLFQSGSFNQQIIYLYPEIKRKKTLKKDSWDMTFMEIKKKLKEKKLSPVERRKLETDLHGRIAIPLATIILGILAVPLGIKVERGDKSISLGISLVVVIVYYVFFLAGNFLSKMGLISPFLGVWIPNFVLLSAGIWLNIQMIRK